MMGKWTIKDNKINLIIEADLQATKCHKLQSIAGINLLINYYLII
jgi:hypothetical protein